MKILPFLLAACFAAAPVYASSSHSSTLPNGISSGDTTADSTVLWARSTKRGKVRFVVSRLPDLKWPVAVKHAEVSDPQVPVKVEIEGLNPATRYFYEVRDASGSKISGTFVTALDTGSFRWWKPRRAPGLAYANGLRFGVSGDWRGELSPYPAIQNAPGKFLDFFVKLGDTIYADVASPAVPKPLAENLADYRLKHIEVYSSRFGLNAFADLQRTTSIFSIIDDHEVINDFAGGAPAASDPRFMETVGLISDTQRYADGLQAFVEYNAIEDLVYHAPGDARFHGKPALYRSQTYGRLGAVFMLDARSFRDTELPGVANPLNPAQVTAFLVRSFDIDPATFQPLPPRTMLGTRQLDRLKLELVAAQQAGVVWKFVMVPEPIQNLGVIGAPDRFEGYARERTELLAFIDQADIRNVVFVAADIHGTLVNNLTYQLGPGAPHIASEAFEITTGAVAYDAPFGPTVAALASAIPVAPGVSLFDAFLAGAGIPNRAAFEALPRAQKDALIAALVNQQIAPLGYDPIGLDGSNINAQLEAGGYTAVHTFGWTEFLVHPISKKLHVTTYGIDAYTAADVGAALLARQPEVVSRFSVMPK